MLSYDPTGRVTQKSVQAPGSSTQVVVATNTYDQNPTSDNFLGALGSPMTSPCAPCDPPVPFALRQHYTQKSKPSHVSAIVEAQMKSHATWKLQDMTSSDLIFWNRAMALQRTVRSAAALLVIGSIQIAFMIFDATCGTLGTRQWLIILVFRRDRGIVDVWTGKVRMADMKLQPVRFEPARRVGVQP